LSGTSERRVDDAEQEDSEPDYRFILANERTFLAGQRTGLAYWPRPSGASSWCPSSPSPAPATSSVLLAALAIIRLGPGSAGGAG
jgi:putative membrane protein